MKSLLLTSIVASTVASAASVKMDSSVVSNGGDGGSYTAQILSGPASNKGYSPLAKLSADTLESFCLEPTEYFSPGSTYDYTINSFADGGANEQFGRNATPGDQLSLGTTWLYSSFARGKLSGFSYALGTPSEEDARRGSNLLLQRAIWYLEDDYSGYNSVSALANPFLKMAAWKFGSLSHAQDDAKSGAYGVWALNITSSSVDDRGNVSVQKHQSQTYYQSQCVPDASGTALTFGAAMIGLVAFRSRQRRSVSA